MTRAFTPLATRFWAKVEKTDGCWLWTAALNVHGYGKITSGGAHGRILPAHRVSWELAHGPIPSGMYVCHRCDNPRCVNPDHLFLGTQTDNMRDCSRKGRVVAWNRNKRFCIRGHEFTPENTRIRYGRRDCRECVRERDLAAYYRRKAG